MNHLSILSYNIWFENYLVKDRLIGLLATIQKEDPDILCLQEVRKDIFDRLVKHLEYKYKYHYPDTLTYHYGCVIFSKHPVSKCLTYPFHSSMGRNIIIIKIDYIRKNNQGEIDVVPIVIATSHFESLFKKINPNKINQYKEAEQVLNSLHDQFNNIILCADTNLMDHEESDFINTDTGIWKDGWKEKGDPDSKITYDGKNNVHLLMQNSKFRSRLDRILYRSESLILDDFKLVDGADGFTVPSDHNGVLCKFIIKN